MHEFEQMTTDVRHWARKLANKLHIFLCHMPRGQMKPSKQCWIMQVALCTRMHINIAVSLIVYG